MEIKMVSRGKALYLLHATGSDARTNLFLDYSLSPYNITPHPRVSHEIKGWAFARRRFETALRVTAF